MTINKSFNFIKGYSFSFEDEGSHIEAWFSSFSGLEKVLVNGKLVSSQRNFSKHSSNLFKVGENEYSTSLQVESLLRGPFVCTLSKNGKAYKKKKLTFSRTVSGDKKAPVILRFLFYVLLGVAFGYSKSYFNLPDASTYVFLAILFFIVFAYHYKSDKRAKPLIEDEEIV